MIVLNAKFIVICDRTKTVTETNIVKPTMVAKTIQLRNFS